MSPIIRLPIGSVEIPSSLLSMLNGTSSFVLYNPYFNIQTQRPIDGSKYLNDKDIPTGSKLTLMLSSPLLLYRGFDGKYSQNFTLLLNNDASKDSSETYTFKSPYSESLNVKKTLECQCDEAIMMQLCKLENILMYATEYLLLAKFSSVPIEMISSSKSDEDLVKALFNHIFNGKSEKAMKYLSERYYSCLSEPPVWMKDDKKWFIKPTENELEGSDRNKFCTLSEVLYKSMSTVEKMKFRAHQRIDKNWIAKRHIVIPSTKIISYEKRQTEAQIKNGELPEFIQMTSNQLKFNIFFDNTQENIAKNLFKPKMPQSMFSRIITNKAKTNKIMTFNDYIALYGGKETFVEGEHIDLSRQSWSGKIVFELKEDFMLFNMGYPKITADVKCIIADKSEGAPVDDYSDLYGPSLMDDIEDLIQEQSQGTSQGTSQGASQNASQGVSQGSPQISEMTDGGEDL